MARGANAEVARAAPGIDERAQGVFVSRQQLGLEHVEARRECELRTAVFRRAARQLGLHRRRAHPGLRRGIEQRNRAHRESGTGGRGRTGAEAQRTNGGRQQFAESRVDHAVRSADDDFAGAHLLRLRVGDRDAIDGRAARDVFEAVRQHHHRACVAGGHAVHANHRLMLRETFVVRVFDELRMELELHVTLRRSLLTQHEIAAPQRARVELGELRIVTARVTHAIGAGSKLEIVRQRELVELHGVRARLEAFEVEMAVVVGDAVAAVFEVHANVRHAAVFAAAGVASTFEHAADDESFLREQFLVHAHQGARFVRTHVAGRYGLGGVDRVLHAAHRDREFDHVTQRDRFAGADHRVLVSEAGAVGVDGRVGDAGTVQAQRAGAETRARRKFVDHLHGIERARLARVLQRDRVLDEVAGSCDLLTRGLAQHEAGTGRIERHVDGHGRCERHDERLAERTLLQAERCAGQRLQVGNGALGGESEIAGRQDFDSVGAGCHQREAEHAGRQTILRSTLIGHGLAGDHFRRVTAHAVIAEHVGGKAGRIVEKTNARAVDRRPRLGIEYETERIDERIGTRCIGRVDGVHIARVELGVALHLE